MRFFLLALVLSSGCATFGPKREHFTTFIRGNEACVKSETRTMCTVMDDPSDPVRLVEGTLVEIEEPKTVGDRDPSKPSSFRGHLGSR